MKNLKIVLFALFTFLALIEGIGQNCGSSVVPPTTINGINVSATSTGSVTTYLTAFSSCTGVYTTPPNSVWLGSNGTFTYTMNFSQPVNNLNILITATGGNTNEVFTFTTNTGSGIPTIIDNGSCFTTIAANVITSGAGANTGGGGGGDFTIVGPFPFTSITISGPGGQNGSLLSICDQSVVPSTTTGGSICVGECIDLIATPIITTGPVTYQWDNGILTNGDSVQVCPIANTTYKAIGTDNFGNVDTNYFDVIVNPLPTVNLGNDTTLCADDFFLIPGLGPGYSFEWQDASTFTAYVATDTGTYFVDVTETATGCVGTDTILISAPVLPLELGADTNLCSPGSVVLDAGLANITYDWNTDSTTQIITVDSTGLYRLEMNDGWCYARDSIQVNFIEVELDLGNDTITCNPNFILSADNPGSSYLWQDGSANQTYPIQDTGTYFVKVIEPIAQCQSEDTIVVSANQITLNLGNDTLLCNPDVLILDPQYPNATYVWSTSETTQTIQVSSEDNFSVQVTDGVCMATESIYIEYSSPVSDFTVFDTIGCDEQSVKFNNTSVADGGISSQQWSFGDGIFSAETSPNHIYPGKDYYSVTLDIYTNEGCYATSTKTINVNIIPGPKADFAFSPEQPNVEDEVSFVNLSSNADDFNWSLGDGSKSNELNPIHTYLKNGTYSVYLATKTEHCLDTAFANVVIAEELILYVPNAFTPGRSSINNTFSPMFLSGFDPYNYKLTIFNRWGEILFESNDANVGWDGFYNSNLVSPGVYIWKIDFNDINNGQKHARQGVVTVVE